LVRVTDLATLVAPKVCVVITSDMNGEFLVAQ
jgi:hypothetical protein